MEETVCLVKPDAVRGGLTERILSAAESDGYYVVRRAEKRLTPARARELYAHLEGTPAFRSTAEFMCSGPVVVAVLSKVDAVASWRERIGPADPNVARETHPESLRAQLGVDPLRNVVHGSATVKDAAREKALLFPSGPLPSLVPKEYLLETLVMPGLVEALGEMYVAQPEDPYRWMSHWFHTNAPPGADVNEEWPTPTLSPTDALEEAAGAECHRPVLGAPLYDGTWNFRRCKDRDPVYGVGACEASGALAIASGLHESGHRDISWVFLGDEPLVYLGGVPVSAIPRSVARAGDAGDAATAKRLGLGLGLVRDAVPGDERTHLDLERMERRLKTDALAVAAENGRGCVPVLPRPDEHGRRGPAVDRDVDDRALAAVDEMVAEFASDARRLPVRYARVPVGERAAPTERGFERLLEACLGSEPTTATVFACRDGGDRATVGMIVGCLVWRARNGDVPERGAPIDPSRPNYDLAEFRPVVEMVERLGTLGTRAKAALDDAADKCNAIVDVRRVMNRCRLAAAEGADVGAEEDTREGGRETEAIERGLRCLERYCWLLLFSAYCVDQASEGFATRFGAWTRARWNTRPKARDMVLA